MANDLSIDLDAPLEPFEATSASKSGGDVKRMSDFSQYLRNCHEQLQEDAAFVPDVAYESSEGIRDVLAAVRSGASVVFVSGRAGTGKSRLIDYMKRMPGGERQVVVAPTGVAALALRASTIHGFFKLPIGVLDADAIAREESGLGSVVRRMSRLVIDEISMVRADLLDGIDARLRQVRENDLPFGGVQVVLVGDFLQLPPVVRQDDREILERLGYETPFAFSARVMQHTPIHVATLKKVWRQTDPDMVEALGDIREGRQVSRAIGWLNERCARPHRPGVVPLLLTATRAAADEYNRRGLEVLRNEADGEARSAEVVFRARASGSFGIEGAPLPAPRELRLLPGVRVMAVRNDPVQKYVNGSLGEVVEAYDGDGVFEDAFVRVRFDGQDEPVRLTPSDWARTRQDWDEVSQSIVETTIGVFEQIPLTLGFAITIHKSQGLTLEDVRIDLGHGAFAPGQLYVALSRAKSVEGLSFVRPIEERDVRVDEMLVKFLAWARSADNLAFGT